MKNYKRVLLKLSGEALEDKENHSLYKPAYLDSIYKLVNDLTSRDVEVAIVCGGGNIFRGKLASDLNIDQATGDYMGMLATVMNAMCLQSYFENKGLDVRVMSSLPITACCETYIRRKAIRHLEKKRVVIFASGTGNPFFTTDTAAALRAKEIEADCIFMGKNGVEGIYSDDPKVNPNAELIKKISYQEILSKGLKVMDSTAVGLLENSNIVIHVFNINNPENAIKVLNGEDLGTVVYSKKD